MSAGARRGKHLIAAGLDDRMRGLRYGHIHAFWPRIVAYFSRMLPLPGVSGKSEAPVLVGNQIRIHPLAIKYLR